jgi:hypothetical protein
MEGFAIYLMLFLLLPWLLHFLPMKLPRWAGYGPALVALIMGMTVAAGAWHAAAVVARDAGAASRSRPMA